MLYCSKCKLELPDNHTPKVGTTHRRCRGYPISAIYIDGILPKRERVPGPQRGLWQWKQNEEGK